MRDSPLAKEKRSLRTQWYTRRLWQFGSVPVRSEPVIFGLDRMSIPSQGVQSKSLRRQDKQTCRIQTSGEPRMRSCTVPVFSLSTIDFLKISHPQCSLSSYVFPFLNHLCPQRSTIDVLRPQHLSCCCLVFSLHFCRSSLVIETEGGIQ